jgi:hypothetical protein
MTTVEDVYKEIDVLMNEIEGEDAVEEVVREYVPYDKNAKLLLNTENIESYLHEYEKICLEDRALIECFSLNNSKELKAYIEEKNINFENLKIETVQALREAVAFLIYEAEEEEY